MPDSDLVYRLIRDFVCKKQIMRERITAREVLSFLVEMNVIGIMENYDGLYDNRDYNAAMHSVQRCSKRK